MFTSFDKALVAFFMAVLSILNLKFGINLGFDEATVSGIIAAITPFIVYFWPNKNTTA